MGNYLAAFGLYAGTAFVLLFVGLFLFDLTSRNEKIKLVSQGNTTAALVMGGKLLGLAFVIGSAIAHSVSFWDMVIWGVIGIVAQIVFYILAEVVTINYSIKDAINEDRVSVGILLMMFSLSIGWIIASSLTY